MAAFTISQAIEALLDGSARRIASMLFGVLLVSPALAQVPLPSNSPAMDGHDRALFDRSQQFNSPQPYAGEMPELYHREIPLPAPYIAPRYAPPVDMKAQESTDTRHTTPLYQPGFVHQNFQPPAYTSPIIHERGRGYAGPITASPAVYPFAYGQYGGFGVSYFPYKSTFGSLQRYPFNGLNTYGPYVQGGGASGPYAGGPAYGGPGYAGPATSSCCQ
jgi:hypothetical protein